MIGSACPTLQELYCSRGARGWLMTPRAASWPAHAAAARAGGAVGVQRASAAAARGQHAAAAASRALGMDGPGPSATPLHLPGIHTLRSFEVPLRGPAAPVDTS